MKVTILQQDITWAQPSANVAAANRAIDTHPGADLYVLPEMFATGFVTQPEGIAEPIEGHTLAWMQKKAQAIQAAIAGSLAVTDGHHYFNRFYFVHPDGHVDYYDKRHLFTYGGEDKHFTAGNKRVVVNYRGIRFLLEVCYDLRFPVWSRQRGDYDVALYVASWPIQRVAAWQTLLRARAIENQCYVVAVNRIGTDPKCQYSGASAIIDPYGETIVACQDGKPDAQTAEIELDKLANFRHTFPVLADADTFCMD